MQKANDKEEILLKKPWTDEEEGLTYFRLKDFEAFLKRNKFFEYKTHKIAQRLRDLGGQSRHLRIKNRQIRVWEVPAFDEEETEINAPSFGNGTGEAPF